MGNRILARYLSCTVLALMGALSLPVAAAPPATPSSVSVTRADGQLIASWPAVSGATSYHVTYSNNSGSSWSLAALNHPSSSITIDGVDNTKTYIVGVRARNSAGDSGWRNSPAAGPYENTPQVTPPATPSSVSVTRADAQLTASWSDVSGATSYHVTYTVESSGSWSLAALNHPTSSITINGVDNTKSYIVGVRARNSAGDSGWRNSPAAGPYSSPVTPPTAPSSVSVTRADGQLTANWSDVSDATSYHVTYTSDSGASWSLAALNHPSSSITISSVDNSKSYIVGVRSRNSGGDSSWRNSPSAGPYSSATITATDVTSNSATIELDNHEGAWYYVASGGSGAQAQSNNCEGPVNGKTTELDGLESGTQYTINAYSNCGGGAIASGQFNTATYELNLRVSGVRSRSARIHLVGNLQDTHWWYKRENSDPSDPDDTCHRVAAANTHVLLTGLQIYTTYTYYAYFANNCLSGDRGEPLVFKTLGFSASDAGATTVTLNFDGGDSQTPQLWYYSETGISYVPPTNQPFPSNCHYGGSSTATTPGSVIVRDLVPNNGDSDKSYTFTAYFDEDCESGTEVGAANVDTLDPVLKLTSSNNNLQLSVNNWGVNDPALYYRTNIADTNQKQSDWDGPTGCTAFTSGKTTTVTNRPSLPNSSAYYVYGAYSTSDCHHTKVVAYVKHSNPISSSSNIGSSSNWMSPNLEGIDGRNTSLVDFSDETRHNTLSLSADASARGAIGGTQSVGFGDTAGTVPLLDQQNGLVTTDEAGTIHLDGDSLLLPLVLASSGPGMRSSVVSIVNRSEQAGTVHIEAFDDSSWIYEPLTLNVAAGASLQFDSNDLEFGNPVTGMTVGTGPALSGHWQLKLSSPLDLDVTTHVRHSDGFVTSMSEVAPERDSIHEVAVFYPASNRGSQSLLRIVNPGAHAATVTIRGINSDGQTTNSNASLTVLPGSSATLTAQQLESGTENLEGAIGSSTSAWRLQVVADEPILVMSLSENENGYLSNLSR